MSDSRDKENWTTDRIQTDKVNRRDSLGRGILKNRKDDNNTVALPLRDSKVGRLSLGAKESYRRRVSFAPEVTLHKIDLIPHVSSPERRQPRRRETIAFAPHTPRELSPLPPSTVEPVDDLEAEEIIYDSSDIEMEDDSHVYSSPRRALAFKIHEDDGQTAEMNISRREDEGEQELEEEEEEEEEEEGEEGENTMDLTKPLGMIQVSSSTNGRVTSTQQSVQAYLETGSQPSTQDSTDVPSSNRPFGAITSLFLDEDESDEADMELTQPIPQQLPPKITPIVDQQHGPEAATEFSKNTTVSSNANNCGEESITEGMMEISVGETSIAEETMDLTSIAEGTTDKITLQNTLLNRQVQLSPERQQSMEMDQTRAFGSIMPQVIEQGDDVTMDETRMFGAIKPLETTPKTHKSTPLNLVRSRTPKRRTSTTPLKAARSHTSETGSPMSSKRRRLGYNVTADSRERINSFTPKKKAVEVEPLQRQSMIPFEPVSTVLSSQSLSHEELKSSFTPLRSTKNGSRTSMLNSGHIEFGLTEKVPLAPSHEKFEVREQEEGYQPVSLEQFLNDLSIEFFDDLNVNEDFTTEIKPLSDAKPATPLDYTIAKSIKIPWLELYSFSCDELQKNMNGLKQLFDNLSEEFVEENPRMVREYYETSSILQQKKFGDHLIQMKQYSDHQAEKAWYSWREKLLDELHFRLEKSIDVLKEDNDVVESSLEELEIIQLSLNEENNQLERQIAALMEKKSLIESSERESLIQRRTELLSEVHGYIEGKSQAEKLEAQVEQLQEQMIDTTMVEQEIETKNAYIQKHTQDPLLRLAKLTASFHQLEGITGSEFHSLYGTKLIMSFKEPEIKTEVDFLSLERKVTLSNVKSEVMTKYLEKYIVEAHSLKLPQFLREITKLYSDLKKFVSDIEQIDLLWPCAIKVDEGVDVNIKIFNKPLRYKCNLELKFDDNSMMNGCEPTSILVSLMYGTPDSRVILDGFKSKRAKGTFLQRINDITLVHR
jgi:hypothetical protein